MNETFSFLSANQFLIKDENLMNNGDCSSPMMIIESLADFVDVSQQQ